MENMDEKELEMKIFITGGTGFIGNNLTNHLLNEGHYVVATGTRIHNDRIDQKNYRYISADTTKKGKWQKDVRESDAVINLAGKTIFNRWSGKYKKLIYDSRILTTRNLVDALPSGKDVILCSTSAAGYYGSRGKDILSENEPAGNDFLAKVTLDWEKEAMKAAKEKGVRVALMRFGVVLGKNGGTMAKMLPAFRLFAGGPLGNGMQWFPWIHLEDLISGIMFIMNNNQIDGPLNFCAPNPVTNKELAVTIGRLLKRPSVMPAPAFMIRLLLGEFGETLLSSQKAVPDKLLNSGFIFQYPDIESAVRSIID